MKQLYIDDELNLQMKTLTDDLFEDTILTEYAKKFLKLDTIKICCYYIKFVINLDKE